MIDTAPPQQHEYPHQTSPDGTVTVEELHLDFTEHPQAYHDALHPYIEEHLSKAELTQAVAEKGGVYSDRLTTLLTATESGYASTEQVAAVLDELRDDTGELAPGSMRLVIDAAKGVWSKNQRIPAAFYYAMADRPDMLTTMVEQTQAAELSDWDALAVRKIIEGTADKLDPVKNDFSYLDDALDRNPFTGKAASSEPTPEEQARKAEKQRMTDQLRMVAAEFPESPLKYDDHDETTREIFSRYAKFAGEGLSLAEANGYNRLIPPTAKAESVVPPRADQIKDVVQKFNASGEGIKRLYLQGGNLPQRLAAVQPYLEQIAAKGGDDVTDRLERFAIMTGCQDYIDEAYVGAANATINRLSSAGLSAENLLHLIGNREQMRVILDHAATADPEAQGLSLDLLAQLGRHSEVAFIEQAEGGRQRVIDQILQDPSRYAEYVQTVDGLMDGVAASGFPPRLTALKVFDRFSPYYGNINVEDDVAYIKDALAHQANIGGAAQTLEAVSPTLADRLINSSLTHVDSVDIVDAAQSVTALKDAHPDIYSFMEQRITQSNSMDELREGLEFAEGFVAHASLFAMLDERQAEKITIGNYRDSILHASLYNEKGAPSVTERFAQLERGAAILADRRLTRFQTIAGELFESRQANEIIELFSGDSIQSRLDDERMREAINEATGTLLYEVGNYDVEKSLATIESLGEFEKQWLHQLAWGEANLRRSSNLTDEQIDVYRDLFAEAMPRRDKDGNYYDDAVSVRLAMKSTYGHDYQRARGASPEALAWYRAGEMPIAGYGTVASWRAEAVAAGVADDPRSVYEWIYKNPEQVARISAGNLTDYIERTLPKSDGETTETILAAARQQLAERNEHFRIFMNISTEALTKVAESGGAIKSILDAGVEVAERETGYDLQRSGVEVALGLRSMDSDTPHPIYGSCGFVDGEIPTGAIGYGDILLTFKETPELAARTSYTPEDSFHGADRLTGTDAKLLRLAKDAKSMGHTRTSDYVESQIQGGLDLALVDKIYVTSDEQRDAIAAALPAEIAARIIVRQQQS